MNQSYDGPWFEDSEVFGAIVGVSNEIITDGTKLEWFWFKEQIITAKVE